MKKIGLTLGTGCCIIGLYAFWIGWSIGVTALADGIAGLIKSGNILIILIVLWLTGISVIAYIKSR